MSFFVACGLFHKTMITVTGSAPTRLPTPTTSLGAAFSASSIDYDATADGKRFVVVRTLAPRERRAVVVENWISRLEGAK